MTLEIFRSLDQRSRSQYHLMQKPCPLNILKTLSVTVMVLGRKIGHGQSMTPINFQVTRSKVKVTVLFDAITMSAQYLEKLMSDSHGTW